MKPELKAIAAQVAAMTEDQRAAIAAQMPVLTIAGHIISTRNTVLLTLQNDFAVTIIGGFRQWIAAGRAVRKGEKASYILKPIIRKSDEPSEENAQNENLAFFVSVPVFDVSQTEPLEVLEECEA